MGCRERVVRALVFGVFWGWVALPALAARGEALTLEAAVRRALEENPEVRAAELSVAAARGRREGAGIWLRNNPELSIAVGPRSLPGPEVDDDLDVEVAAEQPIEIAGQRGARVDATEASLAAAEARLTESRASVVARVRDAFGRVLGTQARQELADEALRLARQAVEAADERYRRGAASLIEVNTGRVEVGRSNRAKAEADRQAAEATAELRLLLAIGPGEELAVEGEVDSLYSILGRDLEQLRSLAMTNRPALIAARHDLEAARAEERLASREAFPTPTLGASYEREEKAEIVQGTFAIGIPLFDRNQAAKAVTRAEAQQMDSAVGALERQVAEEVDLAIRRVESARAVLDGFTGDVLKALNENVALVNLGYEAGKIDFLQLILIRREMLDARRDYIAALEELNSAEAELDRFLGVTSLTGTDESFR